MNKENTYNSYQYIEAPERKSDAYSEAINVLASALYDETNQESAYVDLSAEEQHEHEAAAEAVVDVLYEGNGSIDLRNPELRVIAGNELHVAWLSRHESAKGGKLDVPFTELEADVQNRYLGQIATANRLFSDSNIDELASQTLSPDN